ncbi:MAG: RNA polymerase sigma factor [Rhizobiaceae bacterium]
MSELAWIDAAISSARPQALAALLRYFRDLDTAEEAFQNACLRALRNWPTNGPPRDPVAWLVLVGRNAGIDEKRKTARFAELPPEEALSDDGDRETELVETLDESDYRDDVLRLMFVCCHPDLEPTRQIALALRIVSGLPLPRIARAFLVSEAAMEQRITRAKAKIASAGVPFGAPDAVERAERLGVVAAMIYLLFNEGYSATGEHVAERAGLCDEAIRLARLLLRMYPTEPEIMGLTALMLLQHARHKARHDAAGEMVLLEDQDRSLWNRGMITEGLALVEKAVRHRQPGPYQAQAAIAALHARAQSPEDTDWAQIDLLYAALERMQPSPVITLNRAVAVAKARGAEAALELVEPLEKRLGSYFHFHGVRGWLLKQLGRKEEAKEAFNRAISLAGSVAEANQIRIELEGLERDAAERERAGRG